MEVVISMSLPLTLTLVDKAVRTDISWYTFHKESLLPSFLRLNPGDSFYIAENQIPWDTVILHSSRIGDEQLVRYDHLPPVLPHCALETWFMFSACCLCDCHAQRSVCYTSHITTVGKLWEQYLLLVLCTDSNCHLDSFKRRVTTRDYFRQSQLVQSLPDRFYKLYLHDSLSHLQLL